ncbi:MAG: geranylgeranylglyceryl/heptaprenylglyceryl phosphate synthase, partial [Bacteroidota bacterium]
MNIVFRHIKESAERNQKLLAVLIDPDKVSLDDIEAFVRKINTSIATHIFVGGSEVSDGQTDAVVTEVKE